MGTIGDDQNSSAGASIIAASYSGQGVPFPARLRRVRRYLQQNHRITGNYPSWCSGGRDC